ncbi:hypothetical protein RRG08_020721 [Elysia crispata]|uniref:Uncharacterized protein n=1 Tax=Elysia crispata TaxID=231223 RepID=A0AAE0Z3P4_9GAST|nr:hypothetical protein RRG08_020721 [Elysia crispata]
MLGKQDGLKRSQVIKQRGQTVKARDLTEPQISPAQVYRLELSPALPIHTAFLTVSSATTDFPVAQTVSSMGPNQPVRETTENDSIQD